MVIDMGTLQKDGEYSAMPKAISFQTLGIGEGRVIFFVLFEDGTIRQVAPTMLEQPAKLGGLN